MSALLRGLVAGSVFVLTACEALSAQPDAAAVIVHPTAASRAELSRAVSLALQGAPVTLADDALTRASLLVIEPAHPRDASGLPLSGRDRGRPEQFRLVKSGARCVLIRHSTGQRRVLQSTTCEAAAHAH